MNKDKIDLLFAMVQLVFQEYRKFGHILNDNNKPQTMVDAILQYSASFKNHDRTRFITREDVINFLTTVDLNYH